MDADNDICLFLSYFFNDVRDVLRKVLTVGIHGHSDVPPLMQGKTEAGLNSSQGLVVERHGQNYGPRLFGLVHCPVCARIVNDNDGN